MAESVNPTKLLTSFCLCGGGGAQRQNDGNGVTVQMLMDLTLYHQNQRNRPTDIHPDVLMSNWIDMLLTY